MSFGTDTPLHRLISLKARARRFVRAYGVRYALALAFIAAVTVFSVSVEENYPFSHFPMYSNPNARDVDYYFLVDAEGNPLSTRKYAGMTAPQIKKRLNTAMEDRIAELKKAGLPAPKGKHPDQVPPELLREVAGGILKKMARDAASRNPPLPAMPKGTKLRLGLIETTDKGFRETFRDLVELPAE